MREEMLRMDHVTRIIDQVLVLDHVCLHIFKGEIMGLIAADYKGKTELIELICQNLPISFGRIYFDGVLVNNHIRSSFSHNKVYVIEQKSGLIESLPVADNIFVMRRGFRKYMLNKKVLRQQMERLFADFEMKIDPGKAPHQLTVLERCAVELLKAQLSGCRLIVLRDLSNFLSAVELVEFWRLLVLFREKGFSFLYVGNHHQELFRICDRVALLNKGRICKIFDSHQLKDEYILPYTISFDMTASKKTHPGEETILEFDHVYTENLRDMSFHVKKGECLVLLDMSNSSVGDILSVMTGGTVLEQGNVWLNRNLYTETMARDFLGHGIGVIEDNPTKSMVFPHMSYLENLTFLVDRKLKKSLVDHKVLKSIVKEYEPLVGNSIHASSVVDLEAIALYDMVYYRLHILNPQVVFCVQPFAWGDMFCRRHVLDLIQSLKNKGMAVIIVAVNLSDSLDVADRLVVIRDGRFVREYTEGEFDQVL